MCSEDNCPGSACVFAELLQIHGHTLESGSTRCDCTSCINVLTHIQADQSDTCSSCTLFMNSKVRTNTVKTVSLLSHTGTTHTRIKAQLRSANYIGVAKNQLRHTVPHFWSFRRQASFYLMMDGHMLVEWTLWEMRQWERKREAGVMQKHNTWPGYVTQRMSKNWDTKLVQ